MSNLSSKERGSLIRNNILEFIVNFIKINKYAPTVREIGDGVGLKSTSSVCSHLTRMCNEKTLMYNAESPRTIVVPDYAFVKLPPDMTTEEAEKILWGEKA